MSCMGVYKHLYINIFLEGWCGGVGGSKVRRIRRIPAVVMVITGKRGQHTCDINDIMHVHTSFSPV